MIGKNRQTVARFVIFIVGLLAMHRIVADVWSDGFGHDWTYKIDGDAAKITAVTVSGSTESVSGEIEMPATLGGYPVITPGRVFTGNTKITKVKIPETVTYLFRFEFENCISLERMIIPASVEDVGVDAFKGCSSLKEIFLPVRFKDELSIQGFTKFSCGALLFFYNGDTPAEDSFKPVTVTFDANDGQVKYSSRTAYKGYELGAIPFSWRAGMLLDGWFTECEGGEKVTADTIVSDDMTVYAHWKEPTSPLPVPGEWTWDGDGAYAALAADDYGTMVAVLLEADWCGYSKRLRPVRNSDEFTSWAAANGIYLVQVNEDNLSSEGIERHFLPLAFRNVGYPHQCLALKDAPFTVIGSVSGYSGYDGYGLIGKYASVLGESIPSEPIADGLHESSEEVLFPMKMRLVNPNGSGTIYYTLDGSAPTRRNGIAYADGEEIEIPTPDTTLKAIVWPDDETRFSGKPLILTFTTRNATFSANGGIGEVPERVSGMGGTYITLPTPELARSHHILVGWSDGKNVYAPGAKYTFGVADVVFSAMWRRIPYKLFWQDDFEDEESFESRFSDGKRINAVFGHDTETETTKGETAWCERTDQESEKVSHYVRFWNKDQGSKESVTRYFSFPSRVHGAKDWELSFWWYAGSGYHDGKSGIHVMGWVEENGESVLKNLVTLEVPYGDKSYSVVNVYRGDDAADVISSGTLVASQRGVSPEDEPKHWYRVSLHANADEGLVLALEGADGVSYLNDTVLSMAVPALECIGVRVAGKSYSAYGGLDDIVFKVPEEVDAPITLSFAANGGRGSVADMTAEYGETVLLPYSGLKRTGFYLAGWSNGTRTYRPGARYTVLDEETAFSAVWKSLPRTVLWSNTFEDEATFQNGFSNGKLVNAAFGYAEDTGTTGGAAHWRERTLPDGETVSHFAEFDNDAKKTSVTKYFTFPEEVQNATDYEFTFDWYAGASYDSGYDSGIFIKGMVDVGGVATLTNLVTCMVRGKSNYSGENRVDVYRGEDTNDVVSVGALVASARGNEAVSHPKYWYTAIVRGNAEDGVTLAMCNSDGTSVLAETQICEKFASLKYLGIRVAANRYTTYGGLDDFAVNVPVPMPVVDGDEDAQIAIDDDNGYVVRPSEGKKAVVVTIPDGVAAEKVTVEVSVAVVRVTANGAAVKVFAHGSDITEHLSIPDAVGGVIDMTASKVKEEVLKEALDTDKGAEIDLSDPAVPVLTTAETKPGLTYTLREGETLEGMIDGDRKIGDGNKWTPTITVKGGTSGFYSIKVEK